MKKYLFLLLSVFALSVQAQYTDYWTTTISPSQRPTTSVVPADTLLNGYTTLRQTFSVDVDGSLDNADMAVAFAAVGSAAMAAVMNNYLVDVWSVDTTNNSIILGVVITDITRRAPEYEPTDKRNQYKVASDVFRCSGYAKYAIESE